MTTGHAPDDWLDIPPPPFAPAGDPGADDPAAEGNGADSAAAAEAEAAAAGELPTGEIQVVDVADAEETEETERTEGTEEDAATSTAGAADAPTAETPAIDVPAPTMTGQFRAVAAALAADVAATRAAELAGATDEAGDAAGTPGGDLVAEPEGAGAGAEASADPVDEVAGRPGSSGTSESDGGAAAAPEAGVPVDGAEGGDEVDVAGAAEVPEPPPAPKAWRVPVLRSKRDPTQPPPPDAIPESTVPVVDEQVDVESSTGGELGPRARRRIEAHRHRAVKLRRQRRLAVAGLALLVTTGAALGVVGLGKVRGSTGGRYVDPQIRPDEPGYVALVTPTPTLLVAHKDAAGALSGVSLLSLHAQDRGGSVIVLPVTTVAPFAEAGTTIADVYGDNGAEGVAAQIELILNVTIGETVEVGDARWATLVAPVAPLTLELERAVGEWPAGEAQISADRVGAFLTARTDSETELGRLDRQELFWETWLPLVKAGGRNAVPGEVDVGLGRFVRGLAAGDTDVAGLPVSAAFSADEMYAATEEMLPDLVAHAIPYPHEPSRGSRVQTQLLNGTTQRDLTTRAATSLVAGGAEIALAGNAASFAEPTTRFVYANSKLRDDAQKLRDAFGVGEVVQAPSGDEAPPVEEDRIDVTVILGADALDALGG